MKNVDIAIVGAGVSGTALYYMLGKHLRNISVLLLDKRNAVGTGNSAASNNSQTLHAGEIETNYSYPQALRLREGALALRQYCMSVPDRNKVIYNMPKMVLAVGDMEIEQLRLRYQEFKEGFPRLQWFEWQKIREIEPQIAYKNGHQRPDKIASMGYAESFSAVDYGLLAKSFVEQADSVKKNRNIKSNIRLESTLIGVQKNLQEGYTLRVSRNGGVENISCKFLVMASGSYSLYMAQRMGLGLKYSLLSAAGNFYYSALALRGKVYTMQQSGLPFAAVHGDADIACEKRTRFGPTLLPIPRMERYVKGGYYDYWHSIKLNSKLPQTIMNLLRNPVVRRCVCYDLPIIGKRSFVKQVQKIIPDIRAAHLSFAKGIGGSRPLLIDHENGHLVFGETKLKTNSAIFNIAPATGASTCLNVAMADLQHIMENLELSDDDGIMENVS